MTVFCLPIPDPGVSKAEMHINLHLVKLFANLIANGIPSILVGADKKCLGTAPADLACRGPAGG